MTDEVTFAVDYVELNSTDSQALKLFFGHGYEDCLPNLERLLQTDRETGISLLIASDTGTTGLQGTTTAAKATQGRDDFNSFIRMIGRKSDKELRGGTYGFGKAVFFTASNVDTILVYSRTFNEHGHRVNRFIAVASGDDYDRDGFNYSGRHWWGIEAQGVQGIKYALPIEGQDADTLAAMFKMDRHFTQERPTGTSIAVLDPAFAQKGPQAATQSIANALTLWAWPHMLPDTSAESTIKFSVTMRDSPIRIPDPEKDPVLRNFVMAYKLALSEPEHSAPEDFINHFQYSGPRRWIDIQSRSPKEYLGRLAVTLVPHFQSSFPSLFNEETLNHVALLRNPRMVVKYLPGPRNGSEDNYAGVFIAAQALDVFFAGSEPPAHDDWVPKSVDLSEDKYHHPSTGGIRKTNPVNVALREISTLLRSAPSSKVNESSSENIPALTAVSNALGDLLLGGTGNNRSLSTPRIIKKKSSSTSFQGDFKSSIVLDRLIRIADRTAAIFLIEAKPANKKTKSKTAIKVTTSILFDGKSGVEELVQLDSPIHLGWVSNPDSREQIKYLMDDPQARTTVSPLIQQNWQGWYVVLQPTDLAIRAETHFISPVAGAN